MMRPPALDPSIRTPSNFHRLSPFFVTMGLMILVAVLKVILNESIQIESPILLFFGAISFAAWYGGFRQGLFAIGLALIFINGYLMHEGIEITYLWVMRQALFGLDALIISLVCARMRRETRRARRASSALRASSQRLEKIFSSDMIGIAFSDLNGQITDANDYFLRTFGASRRDLYGGDLNWGRYSTEDLFKKDSESTFRKMARGVSETFEKEYTRPDGNRVICLVSARVVDRNTVVAFVQDITATKRDQVARLTQSQAFLDSVIENIPNMIFVKDARDLRFVRFNKAGEELVGKTRDQLIGRNDYDLFPKVQADAFTQADREVLRGGVSIDIPEEPMESPHGQKLLHTRKIPVLGPDGVPQYLLGISEDITEKKRTERQRIELLHSEFARIEAEKSALRLKFLADASVALSQSLDVQTMLQDFCNVVVRELAGVVILDLPDEKQTSFERLVMTRDNARHEGRVLADFELCPIDRGEMEGPSACFRTGQSKVFREQTTSSLRQLTGGCPKIGAEIEQLGSRSVMIIPLSYSSHILGVMTLFAPHSGQQYDELDLSVAQDLARRAALALENALLYNRAFEASRTKSAFLANISHEIRTPLGAMIGFAELSLEEKNLNAKQTEYISKIVKNGQQLLHIVNDVLDLSKVESDRLQIEKVRFNLPRLLEEIVSLLAIQAETKGLRLTLEKMDHLPVEVITDPLRLRQILINIIGNAIKFTESGEVKLRTQYQNSSLSILIEDTGMGISEEQAKRLFEPFVQIDETMARKFGGTGLGLFLSRKLARLLNGDVSLERSLPGQGSCFKVIIRAEAARQSVPAASPTAGEISPRSEKSDFLRLSGRLLVVEDSIDNQILIQAFLDRSGLNIEMAENGRVGVEKALQNEFDLILMDIQMPEMDGFEAVRTLRTQGYRGRVVALTAHGMKGDRERCLREGFDDFLIKPISRQSLSECVAQNLNQGSHSPLK